uniref:Osmotin-like protein n=1 Tax=Phaseolus vulgaris TaxID=3885 RepID=T2DN75_PHAVU|nr:osmotin-like protein [Phaseolus vulgaris]
MASSLFLCTFFILAVTTLTSPTAALILTLVNNCNYTVWPAIQPNAGHPVLAGGGFTLHTLTHQSIPVPDVHWSGRVWARTGCTYSGTAFSCASGDCGGRLQCNGAGGAAPASLAQVEAHHGNGDYVSYSVSLVDGFNVPMTVTPHEGKGVCPVVGCRAELLATCPSVLQHRVPAVHGPVVACKSGCEAFHTDELCCRNHFNSPSKWRESVYSNFFKHACQTKVTFAEENPLFRNQCSPPRGIKAIFCHGKDQPF